MRLSRRSQLELALCAFAVVAGFALAAASWKLALGELGVSPRRARE